MRWGDLSQPLGTTTSRSIAGCRDNSAADSGSTAQISRACGKSLAQCTDQRQRENAVAQGTEPSDQDPWFMVVICCLPAAPRTAAHFVSLRRGRRCLSGRCFSCRCLAGDCLVMVPAAVGRVDTLRAAGRLAPARRSVRSAAGAGVSGACGGGLFETRRLDRRLVLPAHLRAGGKYVASRLYVASGSARPVTSSWPAVNSGIDNSPPTNSVPSWMVPLLNGPAPKSHVSLALLCAWATPDCHTGRRVSR